MPQTGNKLIHVKSFVTCKLLTDCFYAIKNRLVYIFLIIGRKVFVCLYLLDIRKCIFRFRTTIKGESLSYFTF